MSMTELDPQMNWAQVLRDQHNIELHLRRCYYLLGRIESVDVQDDEEVARKLKVAASLLKEALGLLLVDQS
jgi:hypothetical protein